MHPHDVISSCAGSLAARMLLRVLFRVLFRVLLRLNELFRPNELPRENELLLLLELPAAEGGGNEKSSTRSATERSSRKDGALRPLASPVPSAARADLE